MPGIRSPGIFSVRAGLLNPEVRWGIIDRLLVQAELEKVQPVIVLNKVDLLENKKTTTLAVFLSGFSGSKELPLFKSASLEFFKNGFCQRPGSSCAFGLWC